MSEWYEPEENSLEFQSKVINKYSENEIKK